MVAGVRVLGEAGSSCDATDDEGNSPSYQIILTQGLLVSLGPTPSSANVNLLLRRHHVRVGPVLAGRVCGVDQLPVDDAGDDRQPEAGGEDEVVEQDPNTLAQVGCGLDRY